jgi:hypothetical protein
MEHNFVALEQIARTIQEERLSEATAERTAIQALCCRTEMRTSMIDKLQALFPLKSMGQPEAPAQSPLCCDE